MQGPGEAACLVCGPAAGCRAVPGSDAAAPGGSSSCEALTRVQGCAA